MLEPAVQRHEPGQRARPMSAAHKPACGGAAATAAAASKATPSCRAAPRSAGPAAQIAAPATAIPVHGQNRPRPAPPGQGRPDRQERRRPVGIARGPRGRRAWQPRYRTVRGEEGGKRVEHQPERGARQTDGKRYGGRRLAEQQVQQREAGGHAHDRRGAPNDGSGLLPPRRADAPETEKGCDGRRQQRQEGSIHGNGG